MRWKLTVAVLAGAVGALAGVGCGLLRNGVSARSGLTDFEDGVLYRLRKAAVAADASGITNPRSGPDAWREGAGHFTEECAFCHGPAGRGDGEISAALYPPAPDLTRARTQQLSDGELHHIIEQGIRFTGMPAMAAHEEDEEIWSLVALVRKLPDLDAARIRAAAEQGEAGEGGKPGR